MLLATPDISSVIRAVTVTLCGPFVTSIKPGLIVRLRTTGGVTSAPSEVTYREAVLPVQKFVFSTHKK